MQKLNFSDSSRKRILMVGPSPEGLGGISRVVKLLMSTKAFAQQKIQYVVSSEDTDRSKYLTLILGLINYIKLIKSGCSLVYIHTASQNSFYRKSIFIALALIMKINIILHIHPSNFFVFISNMKGVRRTFFYYLLNKIDRYVVLSKEMKDNMSGILNDKIINILPNPVDIQNMQLVKDVKREKNEILYLGWYNKAKGVYDLVDAIEIIKSRHISIHVNFYGTKEVEKLRSYVKDKNLDDLITVNDWANEEQKIAALKTASMLILPSYTEGIPNVILEAMATQTPIISTYVGGLRDILMDRTNSIIIKPRDPEDICEKIILCMNDEQLRNTIAINAFNQVKRNYDLPQIADKMLHIIKSAY